MTVEHLLHAYSPPPWAVDLGLCPTRTVALAQRPTPLLRWHAPGFEHVELWLKQDDRTGCLLSGNKVRKLEFLLADALEQRSDTVVTCGGIQSNHARATAVAARQLGMDSVLLLRAGVVDRDPGLAGNLLLDRMVGARIQLITPAQYQVRGEQMQAVADTLRAEGKIPYVIPEGGSNALGSWGYIEAVREIERQAEELRVSFDAIVFACGSGGTAAGIALGLHLSPLKTHAHAINVCNDAPYFYGRVHELYTELGATATAEETLDVIDGHVGRGYALSTDEELAYLRDVSRATGVILDPVYTGKALLGLRKTMAETPDRFRGPRILFVHTGGLFGLYSKADQLAPLLT